MRLIFFLFFSLFFQFTFAKNSDDALLWEISHPDIPHKSYLLGTIHISDPEVFDVFNTYRSTTFDSAQTLALEISMDASIFEGIFQLLVPEENYNIKDHLSDEDYEKLAHWLKSEHGMKLSRFEKVKPIFFYFMVNDFGPASNNRMFLDEYIFHEAEEIDKEIVGLENVSDQIGAFDSIPYKDQFDLLLASLDKQRREEKAYKKLLKSYKKQKLYKLEELITEGMPGIFYDMLIERRNENMLNAMLPLIKEKSTFTAIGAGHLPGEKGLIELLKKEGFILKPISNQ